MSDKQPTSVERWNRAVRVAYEVGPDDVADDLAEEALAKSDAEIDAELRAAGVDLEAFDKEGDALFARLKAAHEEPSEVPSASAAPPTVKEAPSAAPKPAPPESHPDESKGPGRR